MKAEERYVASHESKRHLWAGIAEIRDMETSAIHYEVRGDPVLGAQAKEEHDRYRAGLEKLTRRVYLRKQYHRERFIQEASYGGTKSETLLTHGYTDRG